MSLEILNSIIYENVHEFTIDNDTEITLLLKSFLACGDY